MKIKKIWVIVLSIFLFNACSMIDRQYSYEIDKRNDIIAVSGSLVDRYNENSSLKSFRISDRRNKTYKDHKIKLVNNTVKIVNNGKEYIIPYSKSEDYDDIYIYINVYKNGVNITDGDFIAYIGKVQLDTGEIVDIPPLHFKKYIYIEKYNMILDALNQNANRRSFSGTLEEYKKNGWKEE